MFDSATDEDHSGVRFGRTLVLPCTGDLFDFNVECIACPANRRGVMGVGEAGLIRLAGGVEIEREAMRKAPLTIGSAVATSSGALADGGIKVIVHAVVSDALGAPTRADVVRRATAAVLYEADRARVKSLLMPPLGSGLGPGRLPTGEVFALMIEEIVAHLRRFTSRMDRIVLLHRDRREAEQVLRALAEARSMWWGIRS